MLTVSFLQPIILKVGKVQQGQGHSVGGYSWKGNSPFSFAVRYSPLAHEEACEAGPSVHFLLMLQTVNGFCKLSLIRRPTVLIPNSTKKCKSRLVIKKNQNKKLEGEADCFFFLFLSCIAYYLLYPPFPFLLFCFLFKSFHFCHAMPCSSCF